MILIGISVGAAENLYGDDITITGYFNGLINYSNIMDVPTSFNNDTVAQESPNWTETSDAYISSTIAQSRITDLESTLALKIESAASVTPCKYIIMNQNNYYVIQQCSDSTSVFNESTTTGTDNLTAFINQAIIDHRASSTWTTPEAYYIKGTVILGTVNVLPFIEIYNYGTVQAKNNISGSLFNMNNTWNFKFQGGIVDGRKVNQSGTVNANGNGVLFYQTNTSSMENTITDVSMKNSYGSTIMLNITGGMNKFSRIIIVDSGANSIELKDSNDGLYENIDIGRTNANGIYMDSSSENVFNTIIIWESHQNGIWAENASNFALTNGRIDYNYHNGIYIQDSWFVDITGTKVISNSYVDHPGEYDGIRVEGGGKHMFSGIIASDMDGTPHQAYGINITSAYTNENIFEGNLLYNNKFGGIKYNVPGSKLNTVAVKASSNGITNYNNLVRNSEFTNFRTAGLPRHWLQSGTTVCNAYGTYTLYTPYSCQLIGSDNIYQLIDLTLYRGREVTFGAWVYNNSFTNLTKIALQENGGDWTTYYTPAHGAFNGWELIQKTITVPSDWTTAKIALTGWDGIYSQPMLVVGNDLPAIPITTKYESRGIDMQSPDGTLYCFEVNNGGTIDINTGQCTI